MNKKLHLGAAIAMTAIALTSCTTATTTSTCCDNTCEQEASPAQTWFETGEWLCGAKMTPAASIDVELFAEHYKQHPNRWKLVFETLSKNNLEELPLGLTELSKDVKMNVQEYTTRPTVGKKTLFEKHNEYIDVQCIISGEELHGAQKMGSGEVVKEYNAKNDVAMYKCKDVPFYIIPAGSFTIFFPEDMHTTNYGFGERTEVRKIVFKVKNS